MTRLTAAAGDNARRGQRKDRPGRVGNQAQTEGNNAARSAASNGVNNGALGRPHRRSRIWNFSRHQAPRRQPFKACVAKGAVVVPAEMGIVRPLGSFHPIQPAHPQALTPRMAVQLAVGRSVASPAMQQTMHSRVTGQHQSNADPTAINPTP